MENMIRKSVSLKASPSRVWRALTDQEEFGAWFGVKLHGPFVEGRTTTGELSFCGNNLTMSVAVKEMAPEKSFSFSWHPYAVDPDTDYAQEEPTLVTFTLQPDGEGTLLTVTESGFDKVPASRRAEAFRMNSQGWGAQVENIRKYVES